MNIDRAFEELGLTSGATKREINIRFKALANIYHPDKPNGSDEKMKLINKARAVAMEATVSSHELIPFDTARELMEKAIRVQKADERELAVVTKRISHTITGSIKQMRDLSYIATLVTAVLAFLTKDININEIWEMVSQNNPSFKLVVWIVFVSFVVISWNLTRKIKNIENDLDDFKDHLSSKNNFVLLYDEITVNKSALTRDDIEQLVTVWNRAQNSLNGNWKNLVRKIGNSDFAQLIVAKGKELDFLSRTESYENSNIVERYSLVRIKNY